MNLIKIIEQVKKADNMLSIKEILCMSNQDRADYSNRLMNYFERVNVNEFNEDVLHDIEVLKSSNKTIVTKL
jgi:NAD(P)H-nitrite reductase large subunit